MEAALGATTPDVPVVTPDIGQPMQAGGMPEGQQLSPEVQTPEVQPEEQWFLKAETGTVYKTAEAAAAGIAEKDRFIEKLLSERGQFQQQAPAPQVNPQDATNQAIAELTAEWEQELRSDPKFQGASPEAIAEQAYLNAKAEYRVQQRMERQSQQRDQQAGWQQFIQGNPDLQTPLAREIHDNALANGYRFPNPQAHLDAVHAEMFRRGMPRTQSNGNTAINGALQNVHQQRQIFGSPTGSQAPVAEVLPPHVHEALNFARQKGVTDPKELQQIKDTAMNFNASRFHSRGNRV